jgi:hypothetical protein
MSRLRRTLLVAPLLASACVVAAAGSANADEPATQTLMQDYSAGEVWQTSATWGRARHRAGFEWTLSEPYLVRAVAQLQVDWPTGCTIGADVGPKPSIRISGCSPKLVTKRPRLEFHDITIPIRWTGPDGAGSVTCDFADTGTEPDDFSETWTCSGGWMPQQDYFRYSMSTSTVTADVDDDGDGLKDLPALRDTITFVQP